MRKIVSWVLLGLGAFLLVTAIIAKVWAPGQVEKTPLDTDTTTHLAGTADKLNPATGEVETHDVRATSITKVDAEASDDDVVVFVSTTCLVIDTPDGPDCGEEGTGENADPNVISISTEVFATDRHTGEAVDGEGYLPEGSEQFEGLVNKFPFGTEKKDYAFWDGLVGKTVPATYEGTEEIDGLETYKFSMVIDEESAVVTGDIEGFYSLEKTMWVEPKTGSIVKQEQHDVRTTEDGDTLLDLRVAFTEDQVDNNVGEGKDNAGLLTLLTSTVPLIGFIVGPILLLVGGALLVLARREGDSSSSGRRAATTDS